MQSAMNKKNPTPPAHDPVGTSDPLAVYIEYNKALRTWFVSFGVAGPAYFLVNEKVAQALAKAGTLRLVAGCFLFGVAAQVLGTLLNKAANWYVYGIDERLIGTRRHRLGEFLLRQFWIDLLIDVATICAFGVAAWHMFTVFAKDG